MPIRINLLAEERAADDLRRKDPLKRAIVIASAVVGVVILLTAYNTVRVRASTKDAGEIQAAYTQLEEKELTLKKMRAHTGSREKNLFALHRLATNRFLWAPVLNELQYCNLDGIQVTLNQTRQNYAHTEGVILPPDANKPNIPPKATEAISFRIEAQDRGDVYERFVAEIGKRFEGKFKANRGHYLDLLSGPIASSDGKESYRQIAVECVYPETIRIP